MHNEAKGKTRPSNYSRLDTNQSRGMSLKDNTHTKLHSDSANVTVIDLNIF